MIERTKKILALILFLTILWGVVFLLQFLLTWIIAFFKPTGLYLMGVNSFQLLVIALVFILSVMWSLESLVLFSLDIGGTVRNAIDNNQQNNSHDTKSTVATTYVEDEGDQNNSETTVTHDNPDPTERLKDQTSDTPDNTQPPTTMRRKEGTND